MTTIAVSQDVRDRLARHGKYGESMDEILKRMLRAYDYCLKTHKEELKDIAENHLI